MTFQGHHALEPACGSAVVKITNADDVDGGRVMEDPVQDGLRQPGFFGRLTLFYARRQRESESFEVEANLQRPRAGGGSDPGFPLQLDQGYLMIVTIIL